MRRVSRMMVYLIVATVLSTRFPINFIVVGIATLGMEELCLSDGLVIIVASVSLDHLGLMPLGFSVLPLSLMVVMVHVLRSHIYIHSFASRFLGLIMATLSFYALHGLLLVLRGGGSLYIWNSMLWWIPHALVEGACAAILVPYFHRYLTVTWADLRRPKLIV